MLRISIRRLFRGLYRRCECGCKKLISVINKRGEFARFEHGHSNLKGEKSPYWKGGEYTRPDGYTLVKSHNHPFKDANGAVLKHRLVMEKYLGRYLTPDEVVHHKIPIKKGGTNDIENLQLFCSNGEHLSLENKGNKHGLIDMSKRRCSNPDCKDPINTYKRKDNGRPLWKSDSDGNLLCNKCYDKWYKKIKKLSNSCE